MLSPTAIEGLKRFLQHAETLHPNNNPRRENGFAKEFQEIKDLTSRLKKDPSFSTKHGEKETNRTKNRYKDILPYDYTRIILPENNGIEGSDYINGNYIKGPTNEVVYLTAQGPLPNTVDDFWRMIISHKIQISQEEMGDGFVIRTLSAKSSKEDLKVTQFHYTAWPDHDVPRSATPLIELTMSFRAFVGSDNKVPVLVHCSAGCGRTGTICALDYARALIQLGRTDNFSVFNIVSSLRKQRIAMVQTKEQYELVYKAVKELVNDELKKQRVSGPTSYYVNVEIGKEAKEDNTYENVDFIRSIQRLHQEEKNASRKPVREPPPSANMAVIPAPKKDVVLSDKSNLLVSKKDNNETSEGKEKTQQLSKRPSKENLVQSSTQSSKPLPNQKTTSSYENVLPLSVSSKPPLAPRPAQNYVNVVIGSSSEKDDDYVNIPVPNAKNKPASKPAGANSTILDGNQAQTVPFSMKPDIAKKQTSKNGADYEIPPSSQEIPRKATTEPDYVISPIFTKPDATAPRPQVKEGQLIDLEEPGLQSSKGYPAYKSKLVKQNSFDKAPIPNELSPDLHASSTIKPTKTNRPSGQHSLIEALDSPGSADKVINNPFCEVSKEPQVKARHSTGVEAVVSDGLLGKPEKPTVNPRRLSEGSNVTSKKNTQDGFFGTYSVVEEKAVAKEQENILKPQPLARPALVKPYSESTHQRYHDKCTSDSSGPIQKANSTENVNTRISNEQSSVNSDSSDYALVSSPYLSKKSGSSMSSLYTIADNKPVTTKPPAALRRSNSGVLTSGSNSTSNVEGLYATVCARTKKRTPLSTDTWTSNGDLHSQERNLTRSQNSTSSLRSLTSTSSNDSSEDIPPVPVKTMDAFMSPGDEDDAYEAVQRSSVKSSTMDRFKNKARNILNSGSQVPKISIGKRNASPLNTPRSASPDLGERGASYATCQLGYGNRVTKPSGPRSCPEHWPKF
ncbi:tyrosine-protein phosphatase non-receptor type 12-like [Actinia tenebrosa]|uniref:protein-tyrosine-phosphatase n=1 Tax=Actinia tenebrosa TaxID=6105 RepID=A0A6P8IY58_ACTTE|nr:tyrosine-protein phosphatase non-receptor type 12-like [Actinia tenebrosa]